MKHEAMDQFKIAVGHGGHQDEFKKMLIQRTRGHGRQKRVRSATMLEAFASHRKRWGFGTVEQPEHEAAHMILGLALIHMGRKPDAFDYQGSYQAEAIALTIQRMVDVASKGGIYRSGKDDYSAIPSKRDFTSIAQGMFMRHRSHELFERTLAMRLGEAAKERGTKGGRSYHDFRMMGGYYAHGMKEIADRRHIVCGECYGEHNFAEHRKVLREQFGIKLPHNARPVGEFWYVDAGDGKPPYTSGIVIEGRGMVVKPNIPEGAEGFKALVRPSDELLSEIYDRTLPAIELIMNKAARAYKRGLKLNSKWHATEPVYDTILMSELSDAIRKPAKRDLKLLEADLRMRGFNGARNPSWP